MLKDLTPRCTRCEEPSYKSDVQRNGLPKYIQVQIRDRCHWGLDLGTSSYSNCLMLKGKQVQSQPRKVSAFTWLRPATWRCRCLLKNTNYDMDFHRFLIPLSASPTTVSWSTASRQPPWPPTAQRSSELRIGESVDVSSKRSTCRRIWNGLVNRSQTS